MRTDEQQYLSMKTVLTEIIYGWRRWFQIRTRDCLWRE